MGHIFQREVSVGDKFLLGMGGGVAFTRKLQRRRGLQALFFSF